MAINCSNYCDDPMGAFESSQICGAVLPGGLPSMILLTCDADLTDPSDEVEVQALIDAGTAKKVYDISFTINKPTPVTRANNSPCSSVEDLLTYDWTGNYTNGNISATNVDSHNQLFDGRKWGGALLLHCSEPGNPQYITWINAAITFRGGRTVGQKKADPHQFEGDGLWQSLASPTFHDVPAGIFD